MRPAVYFLLSLAFVIFSLWPTFYELSRMGDVKEVRYFELVHNFYTDFNFYLSRIRQGLDEGRLTVVEKYTSEPHQGSFIHVMYLLMGHVGRWVRVPWHRTADIYHMSRVVLGMTLLLITASYARREFQKPLWQLLAFFLAVTASTYPKFGMEFDGWRIGGHMPWWSVMDSLQRITFIPHLIAGQGLMLAILMALSSETVMSRWGNWLFLGVLSFILGTIFPPGLLFVYAVMGFLFLLSLLRYLSQVKRESVGKFLVLHGLPFVVVGLLSVPSLIYLNLMVTFYPWKRLAEFDIIRPLPFKYDEYLLAMGPILPLGALGLIMALVRRERRLKLAIAWVFAWTALLFIFKFIPSQSPLRFSEMITHVPLALLGVYFFETLFVFFYQRCSGVAFFRDARTVLGRLLRPILFVLSETTPLQKDESTVDGHRRGFRALQKANPSSFLFLLGTFFAVFLPTALALLFTAHMFSSWRWQRDFVDHKIRAEYPWVPTGSYVMYPLKDFEAAIHWIQDHSARSDVILSETTAGNYIPVYAGNVTYVGHANTVKAEDKELQVRKFYNGQLPTRDAYDWIVRENFRYIFFGPQEKEDGGVEDLQKIYPFLEMAFENNFVKIFQVKK